MVQTPAADLVNRGSGSAADGSDGAQQTVGSWTLAVWGGVGMVVLLPLILSVVTPTPVGSSWLLALVVTTIAGTRYMWIVAMGLRRLYELTFWVFVYVFLGLAPLVQLRTQRTPGTAPRIDTTLNQPAMLLVILGIVVTLAGLSVSFEGRGSRRLGFTVDGVHPLRTILFALFALVVCAYYVAKVGLGTFFTSRYEWLDAVAAVWGQGSFAPLATPLIAGGGLLVAFIALIKCRMQAQHRGWPILLLTVCVALCLALTMLNPFTSPRTYFGVAAMAIAAVFGVFASQKLFRVTAVIWVLALIFVFPLADYFRTPDPAFKSSTPIEGLITPDFSSFAEINNTLLYVNRYGITDGRQAAGVVLFWYPRRFWPDKPVDTTELVAASRGYTFQNLGAPIWSELYINGGWALLVVGMFILGVAMRSLDNRIEISLRRARAPGVLGCIAPFYFGLLIRGSLLQAMGFLFVLIACSAFVTRWRRSGVR